MKAVLHPWAWAVQRCTARLLAFVLGAFSFGCSPDAIDYTGKRCPCGPGWACEASTETCYRVRGDAGSQCSVLFVMQPGLEPSADPAIASRLEEAHGCAVSSVDDAEVLVGDAAGADLIIISSTSRSSMVGGTFRGSELPVITWETYIYPDLGLTDVTAGTHFGTADEVTELTIDGPSHPLAAGLEGTVTFLTAPTKAGWGVPAGEGGTVASVGTHPGIIFFRPGDQTAAERAIGCRIGMPLWDVSANLFTDEGWALFDAAVAWSLAGCP